jgi:ABC-type multidrug transport system fused ATPase/permease subunit
MITNIYLLILYTLSKNSFPCNTDKKAQLFSVSIRVIFICFIATIVSKPIETIVFKAPLEKEIAEYKQLQIQKYIQNTDKYFNNEIRILKLEISEHEKISEYSNVEQLENYKNRLQKKQHQKDELIESMMQLVSNSNYYIQSIVILNTKYRTCWLITIFTVFIFLFPAYLKNFLREQSFYYETKRTIENRLVKEEYASFKARYNQLFQERLNKNIQFSEPFIDAPFNTIRRTDEREFFKEDDLISDIYND